MRMGQLIFCHLILGRDLLGLFHHLWLRGVGRSPMLGEVDIVLENPLLSKPWGDCAPIFCPQDFPPLRPDSILGLDIALSPSSISENPYKKVLSLSPSLGAYDSLSQGQESLVAPPSALYPSLPIFVVDQCSSPDIFHISSIISVNVSIQNPRKYSKGNMKGVKDSIRKHAFVNLKVVPMSNRGLISITGPDISSTIRALRDSTTHPLVTIWIVYPLMSVGLEGDLNVPPLKSLLDSICPTMVLL